jgi:hypothetical protein
MTPELAQKIRELHRTTMFTQQEIAFKLGVNQGRVNEVIKHGKWLSPEGSSLERAAPLPSSRKRRLRARTEGAGAKPGSSTRQLVIDPALAWDF